VFPVDVFGLEIAMTSSLMLEVEQSRYSRIERVQSPSILVLTMFVRITCGGRGEAIHFNGKIVTSMPGVRMSSAVAVNRSVCPLRIYNKTL